MTSNLSIFLYTIGFLLFNLILTSSLVYWKDFRSLGSELAKRNLLHNSKSFAFISISLVTILFFSYLATSKIEAGLTVFYIVCLLILLSLRLRVVYLNRKNEKKPVLIIQNLMGLTGKLLGSIMLAGSMYILISKLDKFINAVSDIVPLSLFVFAYLCDGFFGDIKIGRKGISGSLIYLKWKEVDLVIYGVNRNFFNSQYLDIQHSGLWPINRNFRIHVEIPEIDEENVLGVLSKYAPVACKLNS